jgi:uncharacterized protein with GYD domain
MPQYVALFKSTDQGRKTIKDSPRRVRENTVALQNVMGIKVHQVLYTLGQYDLVVIIEAQDDETALAAAVATVSAGNSVCETLRGFTVEEMEKVASKIR